jgi:hypothetical protein
MTTTTDFYTVDDVIRASERHAYYFFKKNAKQFFHSRIGQTLYGGRYFVTSEQFDHRSPRLYTIREADYTGKVHTVGIFQQYLTRHTAIAAIQRLLYAF